MQVARLPVYLALDCSSSMNGEPIETVRDSVDVLIEELRLRQSNDSDIWLSIIGFNTEAKELQPLRRIGESENIELVASGGTELRSAFRLLNEKIQIELSDEKEWLEPEIVIMTDGQFGSDWESESEELSRRSGNIIGLAIGSDADLHSLQRVSSNIAHITNRDPQLIRDTFAWVGDVIRVSALGAKGQIFPAPPQSVVHLPGEQSSSRSRKWSDDQTLSAEDLEAFRHDEMQRRLNEQTRRAEAIAQRERDAHRRQVEEQRARRQIDRIRSTLEEVTGNRAPESSENRTSRKHSAAISLARHVQEICRSELESHNIGGLRPSASAAASQCGFYLMAIRGADAQRIEQIVGGLIKLSSDSLSLPGLPESWKEELAQAAVALQFLQPKTRTSDVGEQAYAAGIKILDVLSILESRENDPYPKRLQETIDLVASDPQGARNFLVAQPNIFGIDLPAYRRVATMALDRAATEIVNSGNLGHVDLYLRIARLASAARSNIIDQILLLDVARTIVAESRMPKDQVDCTVFSPPWIKRSSNSLVQVVLHLPESSEEAQVSARASDPSALRRAHKKLGMPLSRGDKLTVSLSSANLKITDPIQTVTWRGELTNVQFLLSAADFVDVDHDYLNVTVRQEDVPLGTIYFSMQIVPNTPMITGGDLRLTGDIIQEVKKAFVSYATVDRKAAVERTRILASLGIEVFIDSLIMQPGERWERSIYQFIDQCDLFYLIWSNSAKASKWVKQESLHALAVQQQKSGVIPEIVPVVLPPPPAPLPWDELSHLQFNDHMNLYAFMQSADPAI